MSSANYWTGSADEGGVHSNSGINNKAVYLMVDGGTFNGKTVTGIGIDKVAKVYYEVQTNLLTSASDYLDLYNALYQGCQNLLGTAEITTDDCNQVRAATDAVEMDQEPVAGFNPEAALCPAGTVPTGTTAFHDDMEGGLGNWTMSNSGSGQNWVAWNATYGPIYGPYATSGVESLFGENVDFTNDQRAAITVSVPPGQPYLHFRHAFEFEAPNYDGGVVEYTTDGGANWNDAGDLIDAGQAYNGTIYLMDTNPRAGQLAFIGSSHGYVSSRLDLGTLAGQNVQFRWRLGTDSIISAVGWLLDDVRVYACDSQGSLAFSAPTYAVGENGMSATITVSRSNGNTGAISVDYDATSGTATAGSDFTATSGTLTWADGESADKTFTVQISDDATYEHSETVNLLLSNPTGGAVLGSLPIASLTITDDDPAPVIAFSSATYTVNEADGSATITVSRSINSADTISVDYTVTAGTATAGSDFTATFGTLTWADGDSADKTFTIPLLNDTAHEGDETVSLTLSNPTKDASLGSPASSTLTITDDDPLSTEDPLPADEPTPAPTTSSGGGGGGAFGWAFILFALMLQLVRHAVVTDARRARD
jgi:hypothetical protein